MRIFILFFIVLIATANITYAQQVDIKENEIPDTVLNAFKDRYDKGNIKTLGWQKVKDNYRVKFITISARRVDIQQWKEQKDTIEIRNTLQSTFSKDGIWIMKEKDIIIDDLPTEIEDSLAANTKYEEWEIITVRQQIVAAEGMIYELEISDGKQKEVMRFYPNGKLARSQSSPE